MQITPKEFWSMKTISALVAAAAVAALPTLAAAQPAPAPGNFGSLSGIDHKSHDVPTTRFFILEALGICFRRIKCGWCSKNS